MIRKSSGHSGSRPARLSDTQPNGATALNISPGGSKGSLAQEVKGEAPNSPPLSWCLSSQPTSARSAFVRSHSIARQCDVFGGQEMGGSQRQHTDSLGRSARGAYSPTQGT